MMQLSSKNDDSSLCYDVIITHQNFKNCDMYCNSRTDVFRDIISLIINQCDPRRPKGASGGHKVSASRAAHASEARLFLNKIIQTKIYRFLKHSFVKK